MRSLITIMSKMVSPNDVVYGHIGGFAREFYG